MIIYAPDAAKNIPVRYKIGDGTTPIYDLPFVTTSEGDVTISQFEEQFAVGDTADEISNATEWTTVTSPSGFTQRQRSCCYGNGYYIIAGIAGQMVYSINGIDWTLVTPFTSDVITGLAYGNGRFVAVDSTGKIFSAALPSDTWSQVYTNSVIIESVRYLNNRFIAVGENGFFATSSNALSWTQQTVPTTNTLIDSAYGNGFYIVAGHAGTIMRSINLIDWFDCSISDFGDIRTTMFAGNGFVIGGQYGKIAYSTDGATWSMATNNTTSSVNWIRAFAYAEKRIYAVMYISTGAGEIWVSQDNGATWVVDKSVPGRLWCIIYGNGKFITSGDNGAIYTLDLDIDWTNEEPSEGISIWHRYVVTLSNGDKIISESYKKTAIGHGTAMRYIGTSDISLEDGDVTNPITIDGETVTVKNGDVVAYGPNGDIKKEFIWTGSKWEEFGNEGNYKVKQQVNSKTATATQTIKSISQNENGDIAVETQDIAFPVTSVNGQKGSVTIDIPTTLADLTADSTHRTVTDDEKTAWSAKSNFSGNYNDLTNKPTIPTRGVVIQPNNQSTVTYFKISNFGTWYGLANNEKVSLLIGSRSGETILFTLAGETATTMEASALRLNNHYSKILGIYYKISENAIYVSLGDWARILSVDVLSDKSGNYTPIVEQIDALPTDAADAAVDAKLITVPIVPFGSHYTAGIVVGNTDQNLVFGGKNARPTYNGSNMALQSDVTSLDTRLSALEASIVTVYSGTEASMTSDVGSDGDVYLVTE